ncbi:MAG: CBS domain-containing protein [Acidimicrobiales bacterium]
MHIANLLQAKDPVVHTIGADTTVAEAVEALRTHRVGALIVSEDGEHIDGIVSERDVVRALAGERAALLEQPVRSIMTGTVITCGPDDEVESVMRAMTEHRVRHVPVVVDGVLKGIVSIGDVVKSRIDELEKDRKELVEYITAR